MAGEIKNSTVQPSTPAPSQNTPSTSSSGQGAARTEAPSPQSSGTQNSFSGSTNLDSNADLNKALSDSFLTQLDGFVASEANSFTDRMSENRSADLDRSAQAEQRASDAQTSHDQILQKNDERSFRMKTQEAEFFKRSMFDSILNKQKQTQKTEQTYTDNKTQDRQKLQAYKLRSQVAPGLLKGEGEGEEFQFKQQLPRGYQAFMQNGPRGRALFITSEQLLKKQQEMAEEAALLEGELKEDGEQSAHSALASNRKLAKGVKEESVDDKLKESEIFEDGEEVEEKKDSETTALRKGGEAKAAKSKGKGEEGENDDLLEHPWQSFGQAIERHTVLFSSADHAESAELVSQANFAGAIIMGAAIHIRMKGVRLNYSGTSHHGLPIPSGDEALDIGRDQVVAGFERDMGQMGVESVFVNGQRFELANADDERKLKALIKDNPELYKMIEDIREAIRETRYYRTCLGLKEEGPGGRA